LELLILFGFIAGAATAVSPCILPVLPVALSAGATGGRRRPVGIVAGLTLSFTFATVLGSPGRPRTVRVMLDGKAIAPGSAGKDVVDGRVTVSGQRLYDLVDLPAAGNHTLTLDAQKGVEGYAFTFG